MSGPCAVMKFSSWTHQLADAASSSASEWIATPAFSSILFAAAIDAARELTVVAMTNTSLEGLFGPFPGAVRDAVYG